jgi:hypothetical protein
MEETMSLRPPLPFPGVASPAAHSPGYSGAVLGLGLCLGLAVTESAQAVPSYSDQTGDPCTSCHVGGYGPQLTAYGRQFKLTGYTDGSKVRSLPLLSAMLETSFTTTAKAQSGPAAQGFGNNNNVAVDQISIFLAGRLVDHLGVFDQITWNGVGHTWSWDNLDLRYAREFQAAGLDFITGATMNNNPTVTDPYNSTPAWEFPYAASPLAFGTASTLIQGALAGRVIGGTVYAMVDDVIYAEAGAFTALPSLNHSQVLGINPGDGALVNGGAPYWRLALQNETKSTSLEIGTFGIAANVYPAAIQAVGTDNYLDVGFDASYQYHATKKNVFSLYATLINETATLNSSYAQGAAASKGFNLTTFKTNVSYYYDQTYGITLGGFTVNGNSDALLYTAVPDSGSRTNSPNSTGYIIQADWTPFGKADSWMQPWANLRIILQYTGYTEFNGSTTNYDGFGRNASDNNTLYLLGWIAF